MAYTKTVWEDYPSENTIIDAAKLNNIEDGIETLESDIEDLDTEVTALETNIGSGWTPITETWTYASATTITVPTDLTTKYSKGMKVKLTQSATVKYFVIAITPTYSDPNTTITLHPYDSSTSLAETEISEIYYSLMEKPYGFPEKPKARVYLSTQMDNIGSGGVKVTLDTEVFDIGNNFDSTTNYQFTVPCSGYYIVNGGAWFNNVIADKTYTTRIYKNNTVVLVSSWNQSSIADNVINNVSTMQYFTKGTTLQLYVREYSSSGTVDVGAGSEYTFLEVILLDN